MTNYARALFLSNTAEERVETPDIIPDSLRILPVAKRHRGVNLISDVLPFGRLRYGEPNAISNAIGYAEHFSPSHNAVIRIYDANGNVIETHEHKSGFKEPWRYSVKQEAAML
jgi:hypothetical protein